MTLLEEAKLYNANTTKTIYVHLDRYGTATGLIEEIQHALKMYEVDNAELDTENNYGDTGLYLVIKQPLNDKELTKAINSAKQYHEKQQLYKLAQYKVLKKELFNE